MNDDDIRRHISELDPTVPKEGARLLIYWDDEQRVYCEFVANKAGYLRAGIEMLRAGVEPLASGEINTRVDLNYLVGKSGLLIKELIRRDDVEAAFQPPRRKATWKQKVAIAGCLALVLCLAVFTVIGVVEAFIWMTGK